MHAAAMAEPAVPPIAQLDERCLERWPLPAFDDRSDKEARGRVLIVAGSREMPGAAVLAAVAALRAGAGKVQVATVESAATAVATAVVETLVIGLPETAAGGIDPSAALDRLVELAGRADALLIGPGLQDEPAAIELARALRARCPDTPAIVDAAAMNAVADAGAAAGRPALLTPHAGEMAHLSGIDREALVADAVPSAVAAAARWNAIVALKGPTTVLAHPDGRVWRHDGGHVGLGTAGSGDVLAGLIAGLAARGAALEQAAAWGVVLHGLAGVRLARRIGTLGYLASELAREVPGLIDELTA